MPELETIIVDGTERFVTPVDATGLPYCFASTNLPPVRSGTRIGPDGSEIVPADLNHMFPKHGVATSRSPALQTPRARLALIGARVQWVDYDEHHGKYNPLFADPVHPQTDEELFRTLAFANSGFVPEYAIDLSGDDPRIVGQTRKRRKWLWTSGQVDVMCPTDVSACMLDLVMKTEADHITTLEIEEFFYTVDYDKKLVMGRALANKIIERAVEPMEPLYQEARRQDLLTFVKVGPQKRPAPNNSRDLVAVKLSAGMRFGSVFNALQQRLATEPKRPYQKYYAEEQAA